MTEDNQFPQLNRSGLISFVTEVTKVYEGVKRITLHHGKNGARYVLLFWLDGEPTPRAEIPNWNQSPQEWPEDNIEVSREKAIIWKEPIEWDSFAEVYQSGTKPSNYSDEWLWFPIFDGEDVPSFASTEYWEVFSDRDTSKQEMEACPPSSDYHKNIGKKGGRASKIKQPILQATIQFINEKSGRLNNSAQHICDAFTKKYREKQTVMTLNLDGKDWDVYYYAERIYCKGYFDNKTIEDSISLNTFQNDYISKAKKEIQSNTL